MEKITALLDAIYADAFPQALRECLLVLIADARDTTKLPRKAHWDEQDVVLITYADQFREPNTPTLRTFSRFYQQHLQSTFPLVHLLPFYPFA